MSGSDISVQRISSSDEILAIRGEWDEIQSACSARHVLLDPLWVSTWWRHFGAKKNLHLLLLRRNKTAVGIAPLMISRGREVFPSREAYVQIADDFRHVPGANWRRVVPIRRLTFPLSITSSNIRSHFLLADDEPSTVRGVMDYCKGIEREWDMMVLEGIPDSSPQLPLIQAAGPQAGLLTGHAVGTRHLFRSTLPATFEEFLAEHSRRYRKRLRQECSLAERRVADFGKLEVRCLRGKEAVEIMPTFLALEARSWKVQGKRERRLYLQLDDRLRAFYRELASVFAGEDRAQVLLLEVGGKPVAGLFTLERAGTTNCVLTFMVSDVPYQVSTAPIWREYFERSIAQGHHEIDFNGKTENVIKWADDEMSYERVLFFNKKPYSQVLGLISNSARSISSSLRRRSGK